MNLELFDEEYFKRKDRERLLNFYIAEKEMKLKAKNVLKWFEFCGYNFSIKISVGLGQK